MAATQTRGWPPPCRHDALRPVDAPARTHASSESGEPRVGLPCSGHRASSPFGTRDGSRPLKWPSLKYQFLPLDYTPCSASQNRGFFNSVMLPVSVCEWAQALFKSAPANLERFLLRVLELDPPSIMRLCEDGEMPPFNPGVASLSICHCRHMVPDLVHRSVVGDVQVGQLLSLFVGHRRRLFCVVPLIRVVFLVGSTNSFSFACMAGLFEPVAQIFVMASAPSGLSFRVWAVVSTVVVFGRGDSKERSAHSTTPTRR